MTKNTEACLNLYGAITALTQKLGRLNDQLSAKAAELNPKEMGEFLERCKRLDVIHEQDNN